MTAPRITVEVDTVGIHSWSVLGGFSTLAAQGRIDLRFVPGDQLRGGKGVIVDAAGRRGLFDLCDEPQLLESPSVDVVFKRSFVGPYDSDVRPLGLVAGYRTGDERLTRLAVAAARKARRPRDLKRVLGLTTRRKLPPKLSSFEAAPTGKRRQVLFQVRAWEPSSGSDPTDRERVNRQRAQLIGGLRDSLEDRFIGGFVATAFARDNYPDLLSPLPAHPGGYARLVRESAVAVSSVGLHGSNPWKLVEYFAGSCATITEPLVGRVPVSPVETGAAQEYRSVEECVSLAERLVATESWRTAAERAHAFYLSQVHPAQVVWNCVDQLLADDRSAP